MDLKMGSLFDGIGGFPLAAQRVGIRPVWASEIEPFPISVTKRHFPEMIHLGDIRNIDGAKIEPVDIITFGSPCQDLSVAGKRQGLKGEQSSLFYEAIRIIMEMREATNGRYPRFALWENVPGALSSNTGEDFRAVLQALIEVKSPTATVPLPPRGKWTTAGMVRGEGWSLAWRVLDAQYFGVPQRRRRIFLVADFASERVGEVLFEPSSLSGDTSEGAEARKEVVRTVENSTGGNCKTGIRLIVPKVARCITTGIGIRYDSETETFVTEAVSESSRTRYRVRRLTPVECERLMGFPDGWTEGGSDSARYKALGNSVAVPVVEWIMKRMVMVLKDETVAVVGGA